MRPFVDHTPPADTPWYFCCECHQTYDGRDGHECPEFDPLAGARGIVMAVSACLVVYALLVAAGVLRFGWRP